ncbi:MGMT family protein [Ornithinimicrobium cerasi]|uniref:MGMT family protein n=1 Tax=Ornithinimicrobium cerasi TaxID=2248773 RepID=UPI000EFE2F39|nr:MGMT family protein [Ornithinimicrobium cerasi]
MDEVLVERVLRAVEQVPRGRVVSYGDVAALVGIGPRHVGNVLAAWGGDVPWWRVTNVAGVLPPDLLARARPHWDEEGIEVRPDGRGCRITAYRADLERLARDHARATAGLDGGHGAG